MKYVKYLKGYKWTCLQNRNRLTDLKYKVLWQNSQQIKNNNNKIKKIKKIKNKIQSYDYHGVEGRDKLGNWDWYIYILLYIKYIASKDLLYSTGNSTQYSTMAYMRKESKIQWIYVNAYINVTFIFCAAETSTS